MHSPKAFQSKQKHPDMQGQVKFSLDMIAFLSLCSQFMQRTLKIPGTVGLLFVFLILCLACPMTRGETETTAFSFLFWTDQELDQNNDGDYSACMETIQAMGTLAGTPFPEEIGGVVPAPDFIAAGGDATGWPTHACVQSWDKICSELLPFPTRQVAGNHDSGGKVPSETFYDHLRKDPFIKAHSSDNALEPWKPGQAGTGIIPGIQYSFEHKGFVFVFFSPTYDMSGKSEAGFSPIYEPDLEWLTRELAKYSAATPKIMICHFNAGSITNRPLLDSIYQENNVILHLCGHWEKIQHWRYGATDWVMENGHRPNTPEHSFSVIQISGQKLVLGHFLVSEKRWSDEILIKDISR